MAPIPGETKVWQYITLMKRIYLVDCPGVVPPNNNASPEDILLRGVVRVENVEHPEQYIAAVLQKSKRHHLERTYEIKGFETATEFLELLARKGGRLLKGGEADVDGVAKMVLNDFLRGKIPWFTPPPEVEGKEVEGIEGRKGALGEMGKVDLSLNKFEPNTTQIDAKETGRQPSEGQGDLEVEGEDDVDAGVDFEGFEEDDTDAAMSGESIPDLEDESDSDHDIDVDHGGIVLVT